MASGVLGGASHVAWRQTIAGVIGPALSQLLAALVPSFRNLSTPRAVPIPGCSPPGTESRVPRVSGIIHPDMLQASLLPNAG